MVWCYVGTVWCCVGKVWCCVGKVWSCVGKVWCCVGKIWCYVGEFLQREVLVKVLYLSHLRTKFQEDKMRSRLFFFLLLLISLFFFEPRWKEALVSGYYILQKK